MRKSFSKTVRSGRSMQRLFYIGRFSNDRVCRHVNAAFLLQCTLFLYNYCVVTPVHCFFFLWTLFLWNDCVVTSMQHFLCIVRCFYIRILGCTLFLLNVYFIYFSSERCFYGMFLSSHQYSVSFSVNVVSMVWLWRQVNVAFFSVYVISIERLFSHVNAAFHLIVTLFLWNYCVVTSK